MALAAGKDNAVMASTNAGSLSIAIGGRTFTKAALLAGAKQDSAIARLYFNASAKAAHFNSNVAPEKQDFFEKTKYTRKVLGDMRRGDLHDFPESVKAFQHTGKISVLRGDDGTLRFMLKIPGEYKGRQGSFEFIRERDGRINHRFFRPID